MNLHFWTRLVVVALVGLGTGRGWLGLGSPAEAQQADPIFNVTFIDGTVRVGRLEGLVAPSDPAAKAMTEPTLLLLLDEPPPESPPHPETSPNTPPLDQPQPQPVQVAAVADDKALGSRIALPLAQVVRITRTAPREPGQGPRPMIPPFATNLAVFPDGERLAIVGVGGDDTNLILQTRLLGPLNTPLLAPLGLLLQPPTTVAETLAQLDLLASMEPGGDSVWFTNGDRQTGGVLGLDGPNRALRFQLNNAAQPAQLDLTGIRAIGFDPALVDYPLPPPPAMVLTLTLVDGSRIGVVDSKIVRGRILARTRFGASINVPLADVVRIEPRTDRLQWLTARTPLAVQFADYFGDSATDPASVVFLNRNAAGGPLILDGQAYDHGLGMRSRTIAVYRVEPDDQAFHAEIGIDDSGGVPENPVTHGHVRFRVLVDRTEVFQRDLALRDPPQPVRVDLAGKRLLVLIADFGDRGDVNDLANWIDARIIRATPNPQETP
ncbi:Glycosyl hydrolase family 98 putative carbohydrate binding module [Isosphaera pallida ATCC 43644]|uniref:Glycosyl hydrolase family 98 putative carbohydrate binding module n=1 Tax=Isosphaera pallida (strain ATCC 43644 / DSM 9630 / IS1B) TaxID=575540 RepID=E8QXQ7_ISOPI|nr:NPCBM/NEW2 domain-containing protein [Isosphaera pallida]ADV64094.1 Glycosyl hydrolase family 98 putative carbohydrate binding module [Isosphaera pallida ATCC 43644]